MKLPPRSTRLVPDDLLAKEWLKERLEGKDVVFNPSRMKFTNDKDSFGRWLAILFVDRENINEAMIEAGPATVYE